MQKFKSELVHEGELWSVQLAQQEDFKAASAIQAIGFYEHFPIEAVDGILNKMFTADLHATLLNKVKYSTPDRFACLVATEEKYQCPGHSAMGVVEVSVQNTPEVVEHMSTKEYCYVCCMAVLPEARRQNVAQELLKGVEVIAKTWGYNELALHVFDDNDVARRVYESAGYTDVSLGPEWVKWLGQRRKLLMTKTLVGDEDEDEDLPFGL